jgi:hypothetical protein
MKLKCDKCGNERKWVKTGDPCTCSGTFQKPEPTTEEEEFGEIEFEGPPPRRMEMDPEDVEEWEAIRKQKQRERDPEWRQYRREMEAAWRKPSEEEEAEIEKGAAERKEAWQEYVDLRADLETALLSAGIEDFELYGAGGKQPMGEEGFEQEEKLSPLEYQGALRAVGPVGSDEFADIVTDVAVGKGFKVDMDRPPSVTHLFGQPIRSDDEEHEAIRGRPFLYIYKTYRTEFPTEYEREIARKARLKPAETERLWGALGVYEDRISEIAHELTDDPHMFGESLGQSIARQIGGTADFKVVREEIKDAAGHSLDIQRAIHMPVRVGDHKAMIYFLAETKGGRIYIDLFGCFPEVFEEAIPKLSEMMVR